MGESVNPHAAELLRELCENDQRLSVKRLAFLSGFDKSTVYRFLSQERVIPIDVWQVAWRETGDERILWLLTGGPVFHLKSTVQPPAAGMAEPRDIRELLNDWLQGNEHAATCARYVANIVSDGKIDRSDIDAINKLERLGADVMGRLGRVIQSALLHREKIRQQRPGGIS